MSNPQPAPKPAAAAHDKHNLDDWVITEVYFVAPMGSPITGATTWAAFSSSDLDRKTTVEESPHHITLVYQAGPDVYRVDVSKALCMIKRITRKRYEERKAKQPGGR